MSTCRNRIDPPRDRGASRSEIERLRARIDARRRRDPRAAERARGAGRGRSARAKQAEGTAVYEPTRERRIVERLRAEQPGPVPVARRSRRCSARSSRPRARSRSDPRRVPRARGHVLAPGRARALRRAREPVRRSTHLRRVRGGRVGARASSAIVPGREHHRGRGHADARRVRRARRSRVRRARAAASRRRCLAQRPAGRTCDA